MKLSPHEVAHVASTAFGDVPTTDPRTGLPNIWLATAVPFGESDGDTDAMHMSDDASSANYGQVDHGLYQISGRWNAARMKSERDLEQIVVLTDGSSITRAMGDSNHVWWKDAEARLIGMGDWRDPYDNARMARALFDEWWRKESAPAYIAEKRKTDSAWQPSGWGAWSVYTSGSAWKLNVASPAGAAPTHNRNLDRARFGLTAPMPAPRVRLTRGTAPDPLIAMQENVNRTAGGVVELMKALAAIGDANVSILQKLAEIRGVFK